MNPLPRVPGSDDEEDLNALRIAALQSLKRKDGPDSVDSQCNEHNMLFDNSNNFRSNKGHRNKKGRFFTNFLGRGGKHTHFNRDFNRSRNANLISIATIPNEEDRKKNNFRMPDECKDDSNSKFSRYDNSDKSESESEEDVKVKEKESPGKLERANSLEALMLELDNEILGKPEELDKSAEMKTGRNVSESDNSVKSHNEDKLTENCEKDQKPVTADTTSGNSVVISPIRSDNEKKNNHRQFNHMRRKRIRSRSPPNRRFFHRQPPPPQMNMFNEIPINPPQPLMFGPPMPFQQPFVPFQNPPFNPYAPPVMNMPNQPPPPFYNRPLSPLAINAESLTTATLAPLSPRSAAFVLENKAIVERRRRSPRRSYSRSLSRSPRRLSISPRRSPISPRRSPPSPRRSPISPRRISRSPRRSPRRRSLSPRRRSLSPLRRSVSPRRRKIVRNDPPPKGKLAVRERLGVKNAKADEDKDKSSVMEQESPKDGGPLQKKDEKKEEKILDPVLEARRKKFETNEIKKKEGIIRLKPKEDNKELTAVSVNPDKPDVGKKTGNPPAPKLPTKTINAKDKIQEKGKKVDKEEQLNKVVPTRITEEKVAKKEESKKEDKAKKEVKSPNRTPPKVVNIKEEPKDNVKVPDEFEELEKLLNENPLPEIDEILQPKVADIFSDEESGSDNEGRFKVNKKGSAKIAVIPFTKLASNTGTDIKSDLSLPSRNDRHKRHQSSNESRYRRRSRSRLDNEKKKSPKREPVKDEPKKKESHDKLHVKNRITVKSERYTPPIDRKFERKIEIKIKNPSKYEKSEKSRSPPSKVVEKVEIKKEVESDDDVKEVEIDEIEPEIIIENDSEDEENTTTEGDLRAQLSKKRAEKLHHRLPVVAASSRLIKCALESAVYKKAKVKKSKDKKKSLKKEFAAIEKVLYADCISKKICLTFNTERKVKLFKCHNVELYGYPTTDVRVPIHLRLGIANSSDIFTDTQVKRKSRKRKSREVLEQV